MAQNACTIAVSIVLTSRWRESFGGSNLALSSANLTPQPRRAARILLLLPPLDYDGSGWRQLLNLRPPLDGKPIAADLEYDRFADHILGCERLRKFDDARRPERFAIPR